MELVAISPPPLLYVVGSAEGDVTDTGSEYNSIDVAEIPTEMSTEKLKAVLDWIETCPRRQAVPSQALSSLNSYTVSFDMSLTENPSSATTSQLRGV
ncbi:hypothetical protein AX15_003328 [Amanita polypyramis BW_CC]|nr:hypothetical protein AX15_003328 [Amanita polypyramis BW_CC]